MNKKGNLMLIVGFFIILFLILFAGFMMVIGSATVNWVFDEAVPELTNLGVVGDANFTEIADVTINPLNNIVQSFTWLTGVLYVLMLIGSFGLIFVFRTNPSRWLIGFYFMCVVILIIASIFMSNIYEDFHTGTNDLATRLQEHTLLSFMILYSPMIMTIISFIAGIILFSGMQQEEFV
jgi:Na+-transporting methylmalonyl-CoA/oxaloacetate decarboxylase gamma subunit